MPKADSQSVSLSLQSFPQRRAGLTLFEVLLTLCLLVVIASLIWPSLGKSFSNYRLHKAADQVHIQWTKARLRAMTAGCLLAFRYEVDGNKYRLDGLTLDGAYVQVNPDSSSASLSGAESGATGTANVSPDYAAPAATSTTVSPDSGATAPTSNPFDKTLPEGVTFLGSQTTVDSRAAVTMQQISTADAGWSEPIFFYPDGTTSTARLMLRNKENRVIELSLRGLTGLVKVSEITSISELENP